MQRNVIISDGSLWINMIVRNLNLISFVLITDASADSVFVNVPHIIQSEDWDCGLACVKMILRCVC